MPTWILSAAPGQRSMRQTCSFSIPFGRVVLKTAVWRLPSRLADRFPDESPARAKSRLGIFAGSGD